MRTTTLIILFYFVLLLFSGNTQAEIVIKDDFAGGEIEIEQFDFFDDSTGIMKFHQVVAAQKFQALTSEKELFKARDHAYWLRFSITNNSDSTIQFVLTTPVEHVDRVDLYRPEKVDQYFLIESGRMIDFRDREFKLKNYTFSLKIGPNQTAQYYLRVENKRPMPMDFNLWPYKRFVDYNATNYFFSGLLYGVLLLAFIVNLWMFAKVRDHLYLWFSGLVVAIAFSMARLDGMGMHVFPLYLQYDHIVSFFTKFFVLLFFFLSLNAFIYDLRFQLWAKRLLNVFVIIIPLVSIGIRVFPILQPFYNVFFLVPFHLGVVLLFLNALNGFKSAIWFLIGSISFLAFLYIQAFYGIDLYMVYSFEMDPEKIMYTCLFVGVASITIAIASRYEFLMASGLYFISEEDENSEILAGVEETEPVGSDVSITDETSPDGSSSN